MAQALLETQVEKPLRDGHILKRSFSSAFKLQGQGCKQTAGRAPAVAARRALRSRHDSTAARRSRCEGSASGQ